MIFTPIESAKALEVLNENCSVQFVDCSYKNDCTDSVSFGKGEILITIGFPNVWHTLNKNDDNTGN